MKDLQLPLWLANNVFRSADLVSDSSGVDELGDGVVCHPYDANLITSQSHISDEHHILLDIDISHFYMESSSSGHAHIIFNSLVQWEKYVELLRLLADCDIIEKGYAEASIARGFAALRVPGLKKGHITDLMNEKLREKLNENKD